MNVTEFSFTWWCGQVSRFKCGSPASEGTAFQARKSGKAHSALPEFASASASATAARVTKWNSLPQMRSSREPPGEISLSGEQISTVSRPLASCPPPLPWPPPPPPPLPIGVSWAHGRGRSGAFRLHSSALPLRQTSRLASPQQQTSDRLNFDWTYRDPPAKVVANGRRFLESPSREDCEQVFHQFAQCFISTYLSLSSLARLNQQAAWFGYHLQLRSWSCEPARNPQEPPKSLPSR